MILPTRSRQPIGHNIDKGRKSRVLGWRQLANKNIINRNINMRYELYMRYEGAKEDIKFRILCFHLEFCTSSTELREIIYAELIQC